MRKIFDCTFLCVYKTIVQGCDGMDFFFLPRDKATYSRGLGSLESKQKVTNGDYQASIMLAGNFDLGFLPSSNSIRQFETENKRPTKRIMCMVRSYTLVFSDNVK